MRHATFAVPGDLATPTGGYAYDRRVIDELRALGWRIDVIDIGTGFPQPTAEQRAAALQRLAAAATDGALIIDGLAFGAMPQEAAALARTHRLIALVHHPLALETGLAPEQAAALRASERAALAQARRVIASSAFTARLIASDYGVAQARINVAEPGTDRVERAEGSGSDIVHVLAVGALVPRKGYDTLVAALARLSDLPWRLTLAGDMTRSVETVAKLKAAIAQANLAARITLAGALPDEALAAAYRSADVFVAPSHLEGYGMAVARAIAHGLPVVATRGGALVETIGDAGLLVAPGEPEALAGALRRVISEASVRQELRAAARAAAGRLPTWRDTARQFAQALEAAA
ncbi:MAG TPA: glycosyltransferase [Xanthobacteraceae bacterium]|nr:glycosyltransferase [Xanthobacteraceae bacterium]